MHNIRGISHVFALVAILVTCMFASAQDVSAEVQEVRIATQFGISYLPLTVMEDLKLVEKHARKAGVGELKVTYPQFGGGGATNDALVSGSVDFTASGIAPLVMLWGKSNGEFKGVAAINSTPLFLNTINSSVTSVKDFTAKDRIAVPTVKVSIQAIILQMAASKIFGQDQYGKLDPLTVSMKHPDAMTALLSGRSEVTAHVASPPFMFKELEDKRVRKVFSSYDILEGPHSFLVLSSSKRFRDKNPRVFSAVLNALEEAIEFIDSNKRKAAEIYIRTSKSKETLDAILSELNQPDIIYTTTPVGIQKFADFMYRTGSIKIRPQGWKDLFFDAIHARKGS